MGADAAPLCKGSTPEEAALKVVEDTVKIHLKNIFNKLKVMDRTQAVVSAAQRGFIELGLHENRRDSSSPMAYLERVTHSSPSRGIHRKINAQ